MDVDERQFNRELGALIKRARRDAGLTQEQLAAQCGTSRGSIANIELGDQAPPPYRLVRIALALSVEAGELLPSLGIPGDASSQARAIGLPDDLIELVKDVADSVDAGRDSSDGTR